MADSIEGENDDRRGSVVISDEDVVFDGFFSVVSATLSYTRFDGARQTIRRLSLERGDSVAVLVVNRVKRSVILVEQLRYSTLKKGPGWIVELPAGVVRDGEDQSASGAREVAEETGYVVKHLHHISTFYVSPGGTSERIFLYVAFVDDVERDEQLALDTQDDDEDIKIHEVPLERFVNLGLNGELDDAKTLVAALWLHANHDRLLSMI